MAAREAQEGMEAPDLAGYPQADPDFEFGPDDPRLEVLRRHARLIADRGHPDLPVSVAQAFRPPADLTPAEGLGLLAAMALVFLSGFAGGRVVEWLGVRPMAALLLLVAAMAATGLRGAVPGNQRGLSLLERVLVLGSLACAVATGSPVALGLVPAFVQMAVARILLASLDDERSVIEKGARISHPLAPDFIGPYCRKLTVVWAALFAASALVIAASTLGGYVELHAAWTQWMFWTLLVVFCVVEFFWRKAWFRYFGRGPFDRLLARVFPPARTERGRRSQDYLLRMRAELARLAEQERLARGGARAAAPSSSTTWSS